MAVYQTVVSSIDDWVDLNTLSGAAVGAAHTHSYTTASINGGVAQTAHLPAYSAKTEFVYLGL